MDYTVLVADAVLGRNISLPAVDAAFAVAKYPSRYSYVPVPPPGGSILRSMLNTGTPGSAVIEKAVAGTGISLSSTGVDAGTGDVTITANVVPDAGSITRAMLNTATPGSAVIEKAIAGTGVTLSSTGADAGTGDVTINASAPAAGSITRSMLNTTVGGNAVIEKAVAGTPITLVSTGADAGTGDVTISIALADLLTLLNTVQTYTNTSGIPDIFHITANVNPSSSSTAIFDAVRGSAVYQAGASALTGAAHIVGALGQFTNNNITQTLGLAIGIEGKIDNAVSSTHITTAVSVDANLGTNLGTIDLWYGTFSDIGSNAGTITKAAGFAVAIDSNTGTLSTYYGFYFPPLGAPANISVLVGYYFDNNPGTTGLKYAMYNADTAAIVGSLGPIITTNMLTGATFQLDTGTKTATATAGAATLNKASGKITTESLSTAAGATYTLTLTDSAIAAADQVYVSLANGTNSAGDPAVGLITPAAGSVTIKVVNRHASAALNGTLVISFASMKA